MHSHVYCSMAHKSQDMELVKVPINISAIYGDVVAYTQWSIT